MDPNNTGGSFIRRAVHDLPLWAEVTRILVVFIFVAFLIIERGEDIEIGLSGFKATRPETPLEKSCRVAAEQARVRDQNVNNEILALQAQVAIKDRDLSETRQKCLAAQPTSRDSFNPSLCKTEISKSSDLGTYFAHPQGSYETELTSIAGEIYDLQSQIAAKEKARTQWQELLDQRCFGGQNPRAER